MPHHTVTVNYNNKTHGFKADPDPLRIKDTDTVSFKVAGAPADTTFKITMNEPQLFSAAEVNDSETSVSLIEPIKIKTTYHCRLFDSKGAILAESSEHQPGGGMVPA